jgi:hypothetical protein
MSRIATRFASALKIACAAALTAAFAGCASYYGPGYYDSNAHLGPKGDGSTGAVAPGPSPDAPRLWRGY